MNTLRLALPLLAVLVGSRASAATGVLSPVESRCQIRTISGTRILVGNTVSCIRRCAREAAAGRTSSDECRPPYGGVTAACIQSRADATRRRLSAGSCRLDCPECYANADCAASSQDTVARVRVAIDLLVPVVYCEEPPAPDGLTLTEQQCSSHIAAELRRFVLAKFTCLRLCEHRARAGTIPPEACRAPLASNPSADPVTVACIAQARGRSTEHIDGTCQRDGAALECHAGRTGAGWLDLVEAPVDVEVTTLLCGSTTGAFLE
jgi:hypothetical protein